MRIVAGRHKGRVLTAPEGLATRPTAERAREALFNILAHGGIPLEGAAVLDAFAGSGALGFEALSRFAGPVTFMETDPVALAALRANARLLGVKDKIQILAANVLHPPRAPEACRLVFMDPPYGRGLAVPALAALEHAGWLAGDVRVVVEVAAAEPFAPSLDRLAIADERRYGAARLVFLRPARD